MSRSIAAEGILWIVALADHLKHDPEPVIVDVRGADELNRSPSHVANALNLRVGELENCLTQINALEEKLAHSLCRTANRSAIAVIPHEAGFDDAHVLCG